MEQGYRPKPLLQLVEHLLWRPPQPQQGAEAGALGPTQGNLLKGEGIEAGQGAADRVAFVLGGLVQQGVQQSVVAHQQGGMVAGLQAEGGHTGHQQLQQLRIGRRRGHTEQFDAALEFLMDPLPTAIAQVGAKDRAAGPKP